MWVKFANFNWKVADTSKREPAQFAVHHEDQERHSPLKNSHSWTVTVKNESLTRDSYVGFRSAAPKLVSFQLHDLLVASPRCLKIKARSELSQSSQMCIKKVVRSFARIGRKVMFRIRIDGLEQVDAIKELVDFRC